MKEVAGLDVRGPVRTCRHEISEWDREREAWRAPNYLTIVTFRPDGQVSEREFHNRDGSVARQAYTYEDNGRPVEMQSWVDDGPRSRVLHEYDSEGRRTRSVHVAPDGARLDAEICTYDSSGRKTRVCYVPDPEPQTLMTGYSIGGTEVAAGTPGAATITTAYDDRGLTSEGTIRDARQAVVHRLVHSRDDDGRLVSEAIQFGGETPFTNLQHDRAKIPPEEREKLATLVAQVFADQTFASVAYVYDEKGRMAERTMRMGGLMEQRTTFRYNSHDDPTEEISEDHSRGASMDHDGVVHTSDERAQAQHTRFDYLYDEHGNWTERIVWSRTGEGSDFQRSNVDRRTITYY